MFHVVANTRLFYLLPSANGAAGDGGDSSEDDGSDTRDASFLGRTASQAVLFDLDNEEESLGSPFGLNLPPRRTSVPVLESMSVRQIRMRLDIANTAFFDKLAAEANKVDQFYNRMITRLPQHSLAHKKMLADILEPSQHRVHHHAADDDADDSTPLLGSFPVSQSSPGDSQSPMTHQEDVHETRAYESVSYRLSASDICGHPHETELLALKAKVCAHYLDIVGMVNFSQLNVTAFDKILKKHDKVSSQTRRAEYMEKLKMNRSFTDSTAVEALRDETERFFADSFHDGDVQGAKEELLDGVREQIIWSRNTIWRDMLRVERQVAAFRSSPGDAKAGMTESSASAFMYTAKPYPLLMAAVVFITVLLFPGLVHGLPVPDGPQYTAQTLAAAHRCLAMSLAVVVLWGQDGLPLYVTGFVVLPTTVLLRLLLDKHGVPLAASDAAQKVFHGMNSSTLMLIICVYTLHAALSKFEIDKKLASEVLSKVQSPEWLLLAVMVLAVLMSMLVSNVASPVLLNSIVLPVLRDMPRSSRPFVQCILLGIAVASNIGGMPSPISSPQNAVALGLLTGKNEITFLTWLSIALPLCAVMVLVAFLLLCFWFQPQKYRLPKVPKYEEKFGFAHYVIVITIGVTVLLWSWHKASNAFGSAGMVAVLPIIVFYGTGILSKEDFNNLPWNVVYLVAGGVALGIAVDSSKLLDLLAGRLHYALGGSSVFVAFVVFSSFMAVVSNLISHTVAAIIVLPVIMEVGASMGHARLLVMGGVLTCSGAMSLPISSFPNMAALQVMNAVGEPYLTSVELLRVGMPMTAVCAFVVLTFGYVWMRTRGF
jgi:phosphate transporter